MTRVLFVCTQNRLRSPTAESVFAGTPGFEVASAGTGPDAEVPLSSELVEWADVIFVMEEVHRAKVKRMFQPLLKDKRMICLDIPDRFPYMDPALVRLLRAKAGPFFRSAP